MLAVPAEHEGIEAFLGKRVHEVLERLYQRIMKGQRPPSLEQVLYRFRALWAEHYEVSKSKIKIVRAENPPTLYREIGERCLTIYYRGYFSNKQDTTLGVEKQLTLLIDKEKGYRIQGFVDRLACARDGVLEIHDYKTGSRALSQDESNKDRQLALYQLMIERSNAHRKEFDSSQGIRLIWHFLQKDQIRVSERTPEQIEDLRQKTIADIDKIEAAIEATNDNPFNTEKIPAQRSTLCQWCEYAKICHGSNAFDKTKFDYTMQLLMEARVAPIASSPQISLRFSDGAENRSDP